MAAEHVPSSSGPPTAVLLSGAFALFTVFLLPAPLVAQSLSDYTNIGQFGGHDYYTHNQECTDEQGIAAAAALQTLLDPSGSLHLRSYMAAINSQDEQDWLASRVGFLVRMGLRRIPDLPHNTTNWQWDSGEPFDFSAWCSGEPSDQNGVESVGLFGWCSGGGWNDGYPPAPTPGALIEVETRCSSAEEAMEFKFAPSDLNLQSEGKWVTCWLTPTPPGMASQIDVGSIRLNGTVSLSTSYAPKTENQDTELKVKFLRSEVISTLSPGEHVPMVVTGMIAGACFEGTDYIKVRAPKMHAPNAGEVLTPGSLVHVTWDPPTDPTGQLATLRLSLDDGVTWQVEAEELANTGSYPWTVPIVTASQARLRVTVDYRIDETGDIAESEFAYSDAFSIRASTSVADDKATLALKLSNPMVGPFTVSFALGTGSPATLDVYDVTGRAAASPEIGPMGPGLHTITLGTLPAGVYLVQLRQGGRVKTSSVTVIR